MHAFSIRAGVILVGILQVAVAFAAEPDDGSEPSLLGGELSDFARRVFQITEIVLDQHVEPPTRQEMLLRGLRAITGNDRTGLTRSVSVVASQEEFVSCLLRFWPRAANDDGEAALRERFLEALGHAIPGGLRFRSAKEAAVDGQFAANQYVGIGISLQKASDARLYVMKIPFARGPAALAGIKDGELLQEVDGMQTEDHSVEDVVDRLRGAEGTAVTLKVGPSNGGEPRVVTLTRGVVPRQTVVGYRETAPETWDCIVAGDIPVGYLEIRDIGGSTVSELRDYEAQLAAQGIDTLILDLRYPHGRELRHAIALADALIDGGTAGVVRSRGGSSSVQLDRDCLFRGWPMAVLVHAPTNGYAEWLAGLLQRRRAAIVVGQHTSGQHRFVQTAVELPNGGGVMLLATAILERDDTPVRGVKADVEAVSLPGDFVGERNAPEGTSISPIVARAVEALTAAGHPARKSALKTAARDEP